MTSRLLPPEEWPRLKGTEAEAVIGLLTDAARVIVVEQDGQIVGCWVLQPVLHAECLWVAPDHRKRASVGRRLWAGMKREARALGARAVATASLSAEVTALLEHVGATKVPGEHYMVGVEE